MVLELKLDFRFSINIPKKTGGARNLFILEYLLQLFILTSTCSKQQSLHSTSGGDFMVSHTCTAIKLHRAFSAVGFVLLSRTVSHLNCAFYHGICPVPSSNLLRPFFSPGLGAPLSSYLEVLLYKFPRWIDRIKMPFYILFPYLVSDIIIIVSFIIINCNKWRYDDVLIDVIIW